MADERKAFLLRVDPVLWKDIEAWSADELRSVNGQIEFILREAVKRRKRSGSEAPAPVGPPSDPVQPHQEG
jgi:hypothetical protein